MILLMLQKAGDHQLICGLSQYLQGFLYIPDGDRRISAIKS